VNFFLKNLLSQEHRRAGRRVIAGLVAYYWDGGRPTAHNVKDISLTGLYMFTQDRWYPGTVIQLTLQETDKTIAPSDRWIIVHAKVVRQGSDGVALLFAPAAVSVLAEIVDGKGHETTEIIKG
jgi:hypothetical protein